MRSSVVAADLFSSRTETSGNEDRKRRRVAYLFFSASIALNVWRCSNKLATCSHREDVVKWMSVYRQMKRKRKCDVTQCALVSFLFSQEKSLLTNDEEYLPKFCPMKTSFHIGQNVRWPSVSPSLSKCPTARRGDVEGRKFSSSSMRKRKKKRKRNGRRRRRRKRTRRPMCSTIWFERKERKEKRSSLSLRSTLFVRREKANDRYWRNWAQNSCSFSFVERRRETSFVIDRR